MATIGLRDLYISKITLGVNGVETYGSPRRLAKAIKADISIKNAEGKLYADDSLDEDLKEFESGEIKLNVNDLENKDSAELLGQKMDDDGVIYGQEGDEPPYFAVGFRAKKPGGVYRHLWYYKVKFSVPDDKFETKGSGISFNTPEITGTIFKRAKDERYKADFVGDPLDPVSEKWFDEVREPGVII